MTNWQLIIVLAIAVIGAIFIPRGREEQVGYNCCDKSIEKCGKCRKQCVWHDLSKKAEQLIDGMEDEDENN